MNFGIGLPLSMTNIANIMEYARGIEDLGFDSILVADHTFIEYEALTLLTAIAMRTTTLRLGTIVLDGHRRSPAYLAHATATLDQLSKGRLMLGVGKGVFNDTSYGFTIDKPVSRVVDVIHVLKKLWTSDKVTFSSNFFQLKECSIAAKPFQTPHPPLWIASFGKRMHRIAATMGDGFITQNMPPKLFHQYVYAAKEHAIRVGKTPESVEAVYGFMPLVINDDPIEARKIIAPAAYSFLLRHATRLSKALDYPKPWTHYKQIPDQVLEQCFLFGTPADCAERVSQYVKAGATYIVFQTVLPVGLKSVKRLAEALMSRFK
jgi:alkanesulfonate monooxygenase SsuD/methylene tetrahydromethanopterin reductase-like flavin-dependent oxidoreductase (luciferase family)